MQRQTRRAQSCREFDPETGLYYYRARYYDPAAGRFLSEDPLQFAGGPNFFAYGINSPINGIDPFGLSFWSCFGKGLVKGAVVTAAVVATAVTVVAIAPAAAPVVTTALLLGGGLGTVSSVVSVIVNPSADNFGYNLGALTGSFLVGGASGRLVASKLSPPGYQPPARTPLLRTTLDNAWRNPDTGRISFPQFLRDFPKAMKTGPDVPAARGSLTGTGLSTNPVGGSCGEDGC